jgi:kynureninase
VRFVDDQPTCDLTDTLIEAIDESTSVVAVSSVQYATGTVVDISRLRQSTIQVGARLIGSSVLPEFRCRDMNLII